MTTVTMPEGFDSAIRDMCSDSMIQAVDVLAKKYGFKATEARRHLESSPLFSKVSAKSVSKKSNGDTPKVKRAKTGYLLYGDEMRPIVRAEMEKNIVDGEKIKPQDVIRAVAARWKAEDPAVRDDWNARSKTLSVDGGDEVDIE